ncbi:hypothetical protein BKA80DRAFT_283613 [Phyllosticta citrichinensis]
MDKRWINRSGSRGVSWLAGVLLVGPIRLSTWSSSARRSAASSHLHCAHSLLHLLGSLVAVFVFWGGVPLSPLLEL